jgi:WD40 repeat protein
VTDPGWWWRGPGLAVCGRGARRRRREAPRSHVASGSRDGTLRAWNLATGKITKTLEKRASWICALAVLPGGRVVSGSRDGTLRVWNLATGKTIRTLEGHTDCVNAVAVMRDVLVASGSDDCTVRIWVATGVAVARLTLDAPVKALAIAGDRGIVAGR